MHAFTASMQALRMVLDGVAQTSKTCLPPFAQEALEGAWCRLTPSPNFSLPPLGFSPSVAAAEISNLLEHGRGNDARRLAIHALAGMPSLHQRVQCMELLGTLGFGPLFFVDDIVAPYPDLESTEEVLDVGLPAFENLARCKFNFGPQKTATMACFDAPPARLHVDYYKLLGIEVDAHLTFSKRLDVVCAWGRQLFEEFFHFVESVGLSPAVIALEIPARIEAPVLYGAELLVLAPRAEIRLNTLQASWAKAVIGARAFTDVRGILAVAECGWPLWLGSLMLEKAIVALARMQLMPSNHPARQLVELAATTPCDSWVQRVFLEMRNPQLQANIPAIAHSGICSGAQLEEAMYNREVRKSILRQYRLRVVRPILVSKDQRMYASAATKMLIGLGCHYQNLGVDVDGSWLSGLALSPVSWRHLRIWWLIRVTGCWPSCLYALESPTSSLDMCPQCGAVNVVVSHAWLCPRLPLAVESISPGWTAMLFDKSGPSQDVASKITFVGAGVHEILKRVHWHRGLDATEAERDRVDQWVQDYFYQSDGESD